MVEVEETVEAPAEQRDRDDVVQCEGFCDRYVYEDQTAQVVAGTVRGSAKATAVTVTAPGGPHVENWCRECAGYEYGVEAPTRPERVRETLPPIVTPGNVASFFAGVTATMLFVLVF